MKRRDIPCKRIKRDWMERVEFELGLQGGVDLKERRWHREEEVREEEDMIRKCRFPQEEGQCGQVLEAWAWPWVWPA